MERFLVALRREHKSTLTSYQGILRRTSDPTNPNYEAVNVADEWKPEIGGFAAFLRDVGPRPDRLHTPYIGTQTWQGTTNPVTSSGQTRGGKQREDNQPLRFL